MIPQKQQQSRPLLRKIGVRSIRIENEKQKMISNMVNVDSVTHAKLQIKEQSLNKLPHTVANFKSATMKVI